MLAITLAPIAARKESMRPMTRFRMSSRQRKHLPDLIAGLAVLGLLLGLMAWHVGIILGIDGSAMAEVDWNASMILLAGAFAAMAVFNMAFYRHLSRVHAADRRRAAARRALQTRPKNRT